MCAKSVTNRSSFGLSTFSYSASVSELSTAVDAGVVVSSASTDYGVDGVVESDSDSSVDVGLSSASIDFGCNGCVPSDLTNSGGDLGVSVSGVSDFGGGDS